MRQRFGEQPIRGGTEYPVLADKSDKVGGGAQPQPDDRGDVVTTLVEQHPRFGDDLADGVRIHPEQFRKHPLGAHLPQIHEGDQQRGGVRDQPPLAGTRRPAAPPAALVPAALLGAGGLHRSQLGGEFVQLGTGHAGQAGVGEQRKDRGTFAFPVAADSRSGIGVGRFDGVVPRSALGMRADG